MMDKCTKNCQHCFFYDCDRHMCLFDSTYVGNINSCVEWKPAVFLLKLYDMPEFTEYNQYIIER
jgi:hypothetical protein